MATRWTSRLNPLSWITRRGARPAPVAPGGVHEYSTPAAYTETTQDDYSAADRPTISVTPAWFGDVDDDSEDFSQFIRPTVTSNPPRPRTRMTEYDENRQTLRVRFREGAEYDYAGVTPDMWMSLQRERNSTGKWLARNGLAGPGSGTRVN